LFEVLPDRGFFIFTSRRSRHLLQILELGYNAMYNDVDMMWLADPFSYLEGSHDVYFAKDMDMEAVSDSSNWTSSSKYGSVHTWAVHNAIFSTNIPI
jgi:rhamnogalacturonan II specific xylosyltransferase